MRISGWSSDVCSSDLRQREGLAAAAAPIDLAALAGAAGLRHPGGAAVGLEGRRVQPDLAQALVADAVEGERGDRFRGVAGQHLAGRRDVEELAAPAAHAGLRPPRVVVGHHVVDDRSEEHTSELQSLMRTSYAVFCLKKQRADTDTKQTTA